MVFDADLLIWYLNQLMILEPGDVVNTGTPAGARPDDPWLRDGGAVELEIDGLGPRSWRPDVPMITSVSTRGEILTARHSQIFALAGLLSPELGQHLDQVSPLPQLPLGRAT